MHTPKTNKEIVKQLISEMQIDNPVKIMEVCGTHTVSIAKSGIKQLIPKNITLISGPGCPVCVTSQEDIEKFLILAKNPKVLITTFGDMIRVPGSTGSLQEMKAQGANIKMVYSPLDAVNLAKENPDKEVVFLGVGFETTAPLVAFALSEAEKLKLNNFSIVCLHKLAISAIDALLTGFDTDVDGFLCPGHVSTIIGTHPYEFIAKDYKKAAIVTGFEASDILEGINMTINQIKNKNFKVENQYHRGVNSGGNLVALNLLKEYFDKGSAMWRGLGEIKNSGLHLKDKYKKYDAFKKFDLSNIEVKLAPTGCICGQILKGQKSPTDCPLFGKKCTPNFPIGPCMVSSEGSCAASYYYAGVI
ncbi:hydrogenase expression/formation protein HypD [Desulfonispora thiosulfatigenes DSM 11270]|uniref:Hydrogenase expression/formation protein HypD n=1 Tax=Desulfonispora thiosulfatigenes DSM 11270 TaxID=656914 RepID=A0A1W1VH58_DESTI|nr:hydrogenase formation protein HypD [Desulfonispora thiosulfatigenes]SMB92725.1 hydrogenase expression/formation protein HypD [Desulfonispora thiosulfatigenes DSM 11270]